jgi:NhaP-type Na+/H+ and K+/H+ antiporter
MEVELPAALIGRSPRDLAVPGEILVTTILRAGKGILPTEGTMFEKDDTLYINVLRESATKLERLLGFRE